MPPSRRRLTLFAAVFIALAPGLLAACSSNSPSPGASSNTTIDEAALGGSVAVGGAGGSGHRTSGIVPFGASDGAGGTSGDSSASTGSGTSGGSGGATTGGNATAGNADPTMASASLTRYLQALSAHDPNAVTANADGAALAYASVQLDTAAIDSDRGATTTVTMGPSSLTPSGVSGPVVTFSGQVSLMTTVSGPKGNGSYTDTISGPLTVSNASGIYRVLSFTYDGAPMALRTVSKGLTVSGLEVTLAYVVSYGTLSVALIGLAQPSGSSSVTLQSATLSAGSQSESGTGDFTGPPTPVGVLRFARAAGQPSGLALQFTSSTGQSRSYSFTF
ncbi:MAG TPA: hypothetical protein VE991_10870 [Acidimicrobiales bacterium]|nr:hypothetical protein [Acidimicrobiales bacterium]